MKRSVNKGITILNTKIEWRMVILVLLLTVYVSLFLFLSCHTLDPYRSANVVVDHKGFIYTENNAIYRGKDCKSILLKYAPNGKIVWTKTVVLGEEYPLIEKLFLWRDEVILLTGHKNYRLYCHKQNGESAGILLCNVEANQTPDSIVQNEDGRVYLLLQDERERGKSYVASLLPPRWKRKLSNPFHSEKRLQFIGEDRQHNLIYIDDEDHLIRYSLDGRILGTGEFKDEIMAVADDERGNYYFAGMNGETHSVAYLEKRKGLNEKVWRFEFTGAIDENSSESSTNRELFMKNEQLAIDKFGNIFLAGTEKDFMNRRFSTYLLKVNNKGGQEWRIALPTSGYSTEINGLAVGGNAIYLSGVAKGDTFLAKYSLDGQKIWIRRELWRDLPFRSWFDF